MKHAASCNALAAIVTAVLLAGPVQAQQTELPPPPPVADYNLLVMLSDAELIERLPEPIRTRVLGETDPRDRFEIMLEASDSLLDSARSKFEASDDSALGQLFLYEALVLVADRQLRSPEAEVKPRDKLFKRFERRLAQHVDELKVLSTRVELSEMDAANAVGESITRIRLKALNSALDIKPGILSVEEAWN